MVSLATVIAFWKRKESQPAPERIIPLPKLAMPASAINLATMKDQVDQARERLKVLKLERQIIGSAVATIYESHAKGSISTVERDKLLQKYKVDLGALETTILENQQVVDLYDLELTKEELVKEFNTRLADIEARIKNLRTGNPTGKGNSNPGIVASARSSSNEQTGNHQKTNEKDPQVTDAEKRIEQIRDEILKAMDRLEQIESEG